MILAKLTVGNVLLLIVSASPNGVVTAPAGSAAIVDGTINIWVNQDGATTWVQKV